MIQGETIWVVVGYTRPLKATFIHQSSQQVRTPQVCVEWGDGTLGLERPKDVVTTERKALELYLGRARHELWGQEQGILAMEKLLANLPTDPV